MRFLGGFNSVHFKIKPVGLLNSRSNIRRKFTIFKNGARQKKYPIPKLKRIIKKIIQKPKLSPKSFDKYFLH